VGLQPFNYIPGATNLQMLLVPESGCLGVRRPMYTVYSVNGVDIMDACYCMTAFSQSLYLCLTDCVALNALC